MSAETLAMSFEEYRRTHRPEIVLFNASDDPVMAQYASIPYRWAPNSRGPSNADGSVGVQDRTRHQKDKRGKIMKDEPLVLDAGVDGQGAYAHQIAEHLYRRYGHLGLVPVYGDGRDDERIVLARRRWIVHKLEVCRSIEHNYELKVARTTRPGMLPPPMPKPVRDAVAFRAKYEREATERARWIAKNGSFEHDDKQVVIAYLQQHFPGQWAADGEGMILDRDTVVGIPVSATPQAQAPAAPAQDDMGWLVEEADKLGVDLTRAELRGILARDADVVEGIAGKLAKAKAKAEEAQK